jgi:hypothetical protein
MLGVSASPLQGGDPGTRTGADTEVSAAIIVAVAGLNGLECPCCGEQMYLFPLGLQCFCGWFVIANKTTVQL